MVSISYSLADQDLRRTKSIGILNVSRRLLGRLALHSEVGPLTAFLNRTVATDLMLPDYVHVELHDRAARDSVSRILWDQWGVYRAARLSGNEWLLLPKGFASMTMSCPVKLAAIVHDTMLDFYNRTYPAYIRPLERWYFEASLRATIRNASVIFTVSDFTRRELLRFAETLGLKCPQVVTIGQGFSAVDSSHTQKEDRVLLLVSPFPHKRTTLAVDYIQRWHRETGFRGQVDCVGKFPAGVEFPAERGWNFHGRLDEAAYRSLLAKTRALVFFSDYEGFGMPPVEATLAGASAVYSDIDATREAMDGRGFSFANDDFGSFASAMNAAITADPVTIATWAGELLQRHSWSTVVTRLVEGLRS